MFTKMSHRVCSENANIARLLFFSCGFYLQLNIVIHHLNFYLAMTVVILSLYILKL